MKDDNACDMSVYSYLQKTLPPVIARSQIDHYFGGLISKGYLENLDSEGKGPRRIKTGARGRVGYLREDLLQWLSDRSVIEEGIVPRGKIGIKT